MPVTINALVVEREVLVDDELGAGLGKLSWEAEVKPLLAGAGQQRDGLVAAAGRDPWRWCGQRVTWPQPASPNNVVAFGWACC